MLLAKRVEGHQGHQQHRRDIRNGYHTGADEMDRGLKRFSHLSGANFQVLIQAAIILEHVEILQP